jgi:ferredoxin
MVIVDRQRCGYCGGCVSLCPVGALSLEVDDAQRC